VFDFSTYPNVTRWLNDMKAVDEHDTVHVVLAELGDISIEAPSMESIKNANKAALKAIKQKLNER
jgi:hypothetical protein